jgi:hypothetical protein
VFSDQLLNFIGAYIYLFISSILDINYSLIATTCFNVFIFLFQHPVCGYCWFYKLGLTVLSSGSGPAPQRIIRQIRPTAEFILLIIRNCNIFPIAIICQLYFVFSKEVVLRNLKVYFMILSWSSFSIPFNTNVAPDTNFAYFENNTKLWYFRWFFREDGLVNTAVCVN